MSARAAVIGISGCAYDYYGSRATSCACERCAPDPPAPSAAAAAPRPGDWICTQCGYMNFARRDVCRCGWPKGDWRCLVCGTKNHALYEECGCGRPRVPHAVASPPAAAAAPIAPAAAAGPKPGDWNCGDCQSHNLARRATCFACGRHKPSATVNGEKACCVCMERRADVLLRPCKHLATCTECARQLRACPVCRRVIEASERVFV